MRDSPYILDLDFDASHSILPRTNDGVGTNMTKDAQGQGRSAHGMHGHDGPGATGAGKTGLSKTDTHDKSLWNMAIREVQEAGKKQTQHCEIGSEASQSGLESTIIFMGSKSAGKTSLILRFLEKEEPPKPTTALEYTFGRKAKAHKMVKDVAHIWELGGCTFLSELVEIPIKKETLFSTSVILVLDLSHPNELWVTMETLINVVLKRTKEVMSTLSPAHLEEIKKLSHDRFGKDHPDLSMIEPFPLPLVIVGTKYDIFQEFDSEKRKMIAKTLRFVAHNHGAALQFCSTKNEGLMNRIKAYASHLVFGAAALTTAKVVNFDHSKPLIVPFGMDSLTQIGLPPVSEADVGHFDARTPLDLWKKAYTSIFPQQNAARDMLIDDPAKDPQYRESTVDIIREQKDQDLHRYQRRVELVCKH